VKNAGLFSSPADSTKTRRRLRKCEMIRAEIRAAHDSITFIERTYRKEDPGYADFSILQQEQDLRRLTEEWTGSGCVGPSPTLDKKAGK
jgi:hypothetical protein